ncbi:hypothetical protein M5K25_019379 [Dendrobium thyrsiflorum]|uniref:Uncharacterized protein n=1 Tax=Dendrobium thyrsiflorum TaxID=117978 RepID=A0ABD0UES1_DENTH
MFLSTPVLQSLLGQMTESGAPQLCVMSNVASLSITAHRMDRGAATKFIGRNDRGVMFGRPLKVDNATSAGSRPSLARVLVGLDITKKNVTGAVEIVGNGIIDVVIPNPVGDNDEVSDLVVRPETFPVAVPSDPCDVVIGDIVVSSKDVVDPSVSLKPMVPSYEVNVDFVVVMETEPYWLEESFSPPRGDVGDETDASEDNFQELYNSNASRIVQKSFSHGILLFVRWGSLAVGSRTVVGWSVHLVVELVIFFACFWCGSLQGFYLDFAGGIFLLAMSSFVCRWTFFAGYDVL